MRIGRSKDFVWALGLLSALALAAPQTARANPFFQKQTGLPCSACHLSGQENLGEQGLNPVGRAFKSCGFKIGCDDARPAPVKHTTENWNGFGNLQNNCQGGQTEWVALRPGKNSSKRDVVLLLEPGGHIRVGLSQGTTYAYKCGSLPTDDQQYYYLNMDQWSAP
jgi:hypothetical protein